MSDSDYAALVAEARGWHIDHSAIGPLVTRLADAIEALQAELVAAREQERIDLNRMDWASDAMEKVLARAVAAEARAATAEADAEELALAVAVCDLAIRAQSRYARWQREGRQEDADVLSEFDQRFNAWADYHRARLAPQENSDG